QYIKKANQAMAAPAINTPPAINSQGRPPASKANDRWLLTNQCRLKATTTRATPSIPAAIKSARHWPRLARVCPANKANAGYAGKIYGASLESDSEKKTSTNTP